MRGEGVPFDTFGKFRKFYKKKGGVIIKTSDESAKSADGSDKNENK